MIYIGQDNVHIYIYRNNAQHLVSVVVYKYFIYIYIQAARPSPRKAYRLTFCEVAFMGIFYFLSFSHLLTSPKPDSHTLEHHLLSSMRILKSGDLLTSQTDVISLTVRRLFLIIRSWIFSLLSTSCSISQIEPTIKKIFIMSLVNQWPGYILIISWYFLYYFISIGVFQGQHRMLSSHIVPFG